jgi:hypothetical protein
MTPFDYPAQPHVRRHGPIGYATAESFQPWVRDEFSFRCVYCLRQDAVGARSEFVRNGFALKPTFGADF